MRNLFILHTQYNIILGTGLVLSRYNDCQNDLVLYSEFTLSDSYKRNLEEIYDHVLYIREKYEQLPKGLLNSERHLYQEFKTYKSSALANYVYDQIIISQDRALERLITGYCKKNNQKCIGSVIEEGVYYSLDPKKNAPDYNPGWHSKRPYFLRKLIYGNTYYTEERLAHNKNYNTFWNRLYVIFPNCVRASLAKRKQCCIEVNEILLGINSLYGNIHTDIIDSRKYVLFFFDLMERYRNLAAIKSIVEKIVNKSKEEGATVLLKYHPRETNQIQFGQQKGIIVIPSIIPAEKLLCDLHGKDVTVFGNATTSIIVAQKFGFKTISIAGIEGSNNIYMINKFKEMGIEVPASVDEI